MPGLTSDEKKQKLLHISYQDFLLSVAKVHPDVVWFYQTRSDGLFLMHIDMLPAFYAWNIELPRVPGDAPRADAARSAHQRARRCARPREPGARVGGGSRHSLPRWQRHHCAAARALAHPGGGAGPDAGRRRDRSRELRAPRSAVESPHASV